MTANDSGPILVISRNLPPVVGGMERLLGEAVRALAATERVTVVGPAAAAPLLPTGVPLAGEFPVEPKAGSLLRGLHASVMAAGRLRPRLVLGGSGVCAPMVLAAARRARCRSMVFVHGLDLVYPGRLYRRVFLPALRRIDTVIANSRHTTALAIAAGILAQRTRLLHPGVELPVPPDPTALADFRARHGLQGRRWLLSVGRLTPRKGLAPFLRAVMPALADAYPDLMLLVVGERPAAALDSRHRLVEPASLEQIAAAAGVGSRLRMAGRLDDGELALAYAGAAALVFPVLELDGDVEGFGMVALEAAAHGIPTFGFAAGGVTDAVADGRTGRLLPPGDYGALSDALHAHLRSPALSADDCRRFAITLAWPRFHAELRTLCH